MYIPQPCIHVHIHTDANTQIPHVLTEMYTLINRCTHLIIPPHHVCFRWHKYCPRPRQLCEGRSESQLPWPPGVWRQQQGAGAWDQGRDGVDPQLPLCPLGQSARWLPRGQLPVWRYPGRTDSVQCQSRWQNIPNACWILLAGECWTHSKMMSGWRDH